MSQIITPETLTPTLREVANSASREVQFAQQTTDIQTLADTIDQQLENALHSAEHLRRRFEIMKVLMAGGVVAEALDQGVLTVHVESCIGEYESVGLRFERTDIEGRTHYRLTSPEKQSERYQQLLAQQYRTLLISQLALACSDDLPQEEVGR